MKYKRRQHKRNNVGSAIVTILVVVAFLTILSTVMLYISGMNYQMKVTDYRTKESFYQAEIPVEELRTRLIKDVQTAFAKAYMRVMCEYVGLNDANMRAYTYRQLFYEELENIWLSRCSSTEDGQKDWKSAIEAVVQSASSGNWTVNVDNLHLDSSQLDAGQIYFGDIEFTYNSADNYVSIIKTKYCITIPYINWDENAPPAQTESDFNECVVYMNWTKN